MEPVARYQQSVCNGWVLHGIVSLSETIPDLSGIYGESVRLCSREVEKGWGNLIVIICNHVGTWKAEKWKYIPLCLCGKRITHFFPALLTNSFIIPFGASA